MPAMKHKNIRTATPVETFPGVVRKTLTYNDHAMLCHFKIDRGATLPLHRHDPVQIGICLEGRIRFLAEKPEDEFETVAGDGYVIAANQLHGLKALENSVYVEVFTPSRPEYADF